MERFGVDNAFKSEEVHMKCSATMLQRYDAEYTLQSKELTEKVKETMMRKFGVEHPMQSEEIKQRTRETNQIRFGVDHPMKLDKFKQRSIDNNKAKHGGIHSSAIPEVKAKVATKSKLTCNLKYNVDYYAQSYEYHKNKNHKFHSEKYPGLTFDSTWEVKVYEFCRDNNIPVEYSPSISYKYEYGGRTWTYHPDFLINGKVYEVKGDHFFKYNESSGQEEMFCPYRRKEWTEDEYEWRCGRYEAKHQCMIANNVTILRKKNIDNLS